MARVYTQKAAKDYPNHGINKGDIYYTWTPYGSPRRFSKTFPPPSLVESNPTRAVWLGLQEQAFNDLDQCVDIADIENLMHEVASDSEDISTELREKAENIEDGFGHETEMSEQFNEQAEEIDGWASDITNLDPPEDPGEKPIAPERKDFPQTDEGTEQFDSAEEEFSFELEEWKEAWEARNSEEAIDDFRSVALDALSEAPEI